MVALEFTRLDDSIFNAHIYINRSLSISQTNIIDNGNRWHRFNHLYS